jgi:DNA-binding transcriptional ArsR family regulator
MDKYSHYSTVLPASKAIIQSSTYPGKINLRKQTLAHIFASIYLHKMKARRDVYQAIADPTRRAIISMIATGAQNVNSIAENFDMSRQAVSLHLKILVDCGLVLVRQEGRDRYCEARLERLGEVSAWVEQYRQHYEGKLDSLENYLEKIKKQRHGKQKK